MGAVLAPLIGARAPRVCFPAVTPSPLLFPQWSLAHQNITALPDPRSYPHQPETWGPGRPSNAPASVSSPVPRGCRQGGRLGRESPRGCDWKCVPVFSGLRLGRKEVAESRCLRHQSLWVDSESSIWFINTNTLGMSPGTANWMGVHGSQGMCLSPPAASPVPAAGSPGLARLALGEGQEVTSRAGSPLPSGQGPALWSQFHRELTVPALGELLLLSPLFSIRKWATGAAETAWTWGSILVGWWKAE